MYKCGMIIIRNKMRKVIPTKKEKKKHTELKRGITSEWYYAIKWIAIVCMVICHMFKALDFGCSEDTLMMTKMIGKMAYPLFAWELVECFHFTKHRVKHLFTITVLAVLSEIPYDMALKKAWFDWGWQNVCFTFLIGWLVIWSFNVDWDKTLFDMGVTGKGVRKAAPIFAPVAVSFPLMWLSEKACVDYIYHGIWLIFLFEFAYHRKHRKLFEFLAISTFIGSMGLDSYLLYLTCFFCLIPMWLAECKGRKNTDENTNPAPIGKVLLSKPSVWICRLFYPAHLIVLAVIGELMK